MGESSWLAVYICEFINGKSCDWMNKVGDNCLEFCPNGTLTHKDERARRWQKKMSSISQWI